MDQGSGRKGQMMTEQSQAVTKPPTHLGRAGQKCCCGFAGLRPCRHLLNTNTSSHFKCVFPYNMGKNKDEVLFH